MGVRPGFTASAVGAARGTWTATYTWAKVPKNAQVNAGRLKNEELGAAG